MKTVGIACCVNPNKLPYPFLYLHTCLLSRSLASFLPIYPRLFLHSYFSLLLYPSKTVPLSFLHLHCGSEPYQSLVINLLSDELVFTEWVAGFSGDRVDGAFFHLLLYGTEKREEGLPGTLLHKEKKDTVTFTLLNFTPTTYRECGLSFSYSVTVIDILKGALQLWHKCVHFNWRSNFSHMDFSKLDPWWTDRQSWDPVRYCNFFCIFSLWFKIVLWLTHCGMPWKKKVNS